MASKRVFVGNLSYGVDEKRLKEYFGEVGTVVSVRIPTDESGKSRGFAFVEFDSEAEGGFAVEVFDGRRFAGREISVRPAHPKGAAKGAPREAAQPTPAASSDAGWREWDRDEDPYEETHRGRKPIRNWQRLRGTKRAL